MSSRSVADRDGGNRGIEHRGQAETLGIVLVLGVMLLGAVTIVALGATAVNDTKDELSEDRARKAMTQFDSKAGLVALGEADSQRVSFPVDNSEQFQVVEGGAWMNVTFENQTSEFEEEIVNVSLGSVVYEGGGSKMAYQGGGVFRTDDRGGSMIAPPEFHFRNGTLTLPTVNITGDLDLGNAAVITQNGVERHFPTRDATDNFTNPLENHLVTVTVKSEYYRGWGEYFEERTDGEVEYDDDNELVELTLVSPIEVTTVTSAASSLAAQGDFTVNGNSATDCGNAPAGDRYSDSYNSTGTSKDYCEQVGDGETNWNGDIIYGGTIDIGTGAGGSDFCGQIKGEDVTTASTGDNDGSECGEGQGGQPTIYGNISYTGSCSNCGDALASYSGAPFGTEQIGEIDTVAKIDWHVNNSIDRIEDDADETNPTLNDGTELDAGTYFFDSMTVGSGDEIELNTTDGTVEIAVDQNIDVQSSAQLNVTGNGTVEVYVRGDSIGSDDHLEMGGDAGIVNAGDNATKFRLYGMEDFNATLGNGGAGSLATYVGIIYAPPGADGSGEIVLDGAEVFGGLLTGTTTIPSGGSGSIHFDEALRGENVISPGASVIKVTYLHVTVNRITIESG